MYVILLLISYNFPLLNLINLVINDIIYDNIYWFLFNYRYKFCYRSQTLRVIRTRRTRWYPISYLEISDFGTIWKFYYVIDCLQYYPANAQSKYIFFFFWNNLIFYDSRFLIIFSNFFPLVQWCPMVFHRDSQLFQLGLYTAFHSGVCI